MQTLVGIVMGSSSDRDVMQHTVDTLEKLGIGYEFKVISAHRSPDLLFEWVSGAESRGLEVIIAAAGLAAHLPGVTAAKTDLPVLGVPLASGVLNGVDALLSIVQMPGGVPVGTLGIGKHGAINAALLAGRMLANKYPKIREAVIEFRTKQTQAAIDNQ